MQRESIYGFGGYGFKGVMGTLSKLASITTIVVSIQLNSAGMTPALADSSIPSKMLFHQRSDQSSLLADYEPPATEGSPGKTGDAGTHCIPKPNLQTAAIT